MTINYQEKETSLISEQTTQEVSYFMDYYEEASKFLKAAKGLVIAS